MPQTRWLKQQTFVFLEFLESKVNVLADLVTGKGSEPGLQSAAYLLCPHMAEVVGVGGRERVGRRERERET